MLSLESLGCGIQGDQLAPSRVSTFNKEQTEPQEAPMGLMGLCMRGEWAGTGGHVAKGGTLKSWKGVWTAR